MKKNFTFLLLLTIFSCGIFAQSLQLKTHSGTVVPNGSTIFLKWNFGDTTTDVYVELKMQNTSASAANYKAIKINKVLPGTQTSYFCFAGGCFPDTVTVSPTALALAAGQEVTDFSAHIKPNAATGNSVVYYKFYNVANPRDTVSVYVQTQIWHLGIENNSMAAEISTAYPNPANTHFTVDFKLLEQGTARLVLQNILGTTVREVILQAESGKVQMNVSDLPEGIYMYSVILNGKSIAGRKLLVRH